MTRVPDYFRESTIKNRQVNAVWRGVGFIILVLLSVGAFWLAGYLLELNWQTPFLPSLPFRVPNHFTVTIVKWLPALPGKLLVQLGATLLIDVIAYAVMVVFYAVLFPIRPGPTDAKQPRGHGRRSMRR